MNSIKKKTTDKRRRIRREIESYSANALYMAFFFGVFSNYRRLVLAQYQISYKDYGVSIIKALILAKVILVAESLRLGQRFDDKPLIVPTLYKSIIFTLCVIIFSLVEFLIRGLIHGNGLIGAIGATASRFTYDGFAEALVVFFAFIPFFAVRELSRVTGEGKLKRLFFQKRQVDQIDLDS